MPDVKKPRNEGLQADLVAQAFSPAASGFFTPSKGRAPFLAIAMAGLVPCLILGSSQFIGYDGWWHLFAATQDRWIALYREWKFIAHPPLFYPLLRLVALFSHRLLVLRSISILCGCAGSYIFGLIASKLYQHRTTALLATAAYTFAWSMIDLNCAVRAYAMALLFVLLAFNAYVDWSADPIGPQAGRAVVRFGVFSLLGLLSEYYVILFVAGCFGVTVLRAITNADFRALLIQSVKLYWSQWNFSVVSIVALFPIMLQMHISNQSPILWYLKTYYWTDDGQVGLDGFMLTNFEKEISYFTPFNIDPDVMLALVALLFLPALIYFVFIRKNRWQGPYLGAPPLIVAALLAQLVILALAGRYPFGGEFRHQSILAPFVFLTAFLLVDALGRNPTFAAIAVLLAASFAYGWTVYPWSSTEPESAEYLQFRTLFPNPENIYDDALSWVFFYSQNHRSKWSYQDRYFAGERLITIHQVGDGSGHPIRVLRDSSGLFDFNNPDSYRDLAGLIQKEKLTSIVVFSEGAERTPSTIKAFEEKFRTLAAQAGLEPGRSSLTENHVFMEFKLRATGARP